MRHWIIVALVAIVAAGIGAAAALYFAFPNQVQLVGGETRSELLSLNAPPGTLTTEANAAYKGAAVPAAAAGPAPGAAAGDWPSYNKTLTSDRFSALNEINRENAGRLKVLCTYDTGIYTGFNTGILAVNGALLFSTQYDTFSIDPVTCRENWRKHESYTPATPQAVNRGVAYLDGRIFRGTQDGRVLAYDFKTGDRL